MPSPYCWGGRGDVPQGGFSAPPVGVCLLQPSGPSLGLPAGPVSAEGLLLVRTLTGDSGWLLRLRGGRRVGKWRGTERSCAVVVRLLLGNVVAGQVPAVRGAANVVRVR